MKQLFNEVLPSDILRPSLVLFIKCCTFCFFILSIFISFSSVFAATIFVPGDYATIQEAINASSTGDTVSVAAGTYYENILFFRDKTITLISENGALSTVIDGGNKGRVVTFLPGSNSTLDGFTITNGSTVGSTVENGGGILIGSSSPTITNCIIKNNTSNRNGGGLAFNTSEPTIVNCTFSNNTAAVNGGAISFNNSAPIITNCTFSNNNASDNGGAIACSIPQSGTAMANSILWGDSPDEIYCYSAIISITYSDIQGETTWPGTGNINTDPMFVDEANGDFRLSEDSPCIDAGDNSALALPATDIAGDDRKIDVPEVDDTGNGTPPIVDIGAFEYENPISGGGGCFIATAAYDSYWEPHVMTLRQFRDEYLLTNRLGTNFVGAYYKYSPPLADYIAEHDGLRTTVRIGLAPLVGFSWLSINFGIFTAMVILVSFLTLMISGTFLMFKSKKNY